MILYLDKDSMLLLQAIKCYDTEIYWDTMNHVLSMWKKNKDLTINFFGD